MLLPKVRYDDVYAVYNLSTHKMMAQSHTMVY